MHVDISLHQQHKNQCVYAADQAFTEQMPWPRSKCPWAFFNLLNKCCIPQILVVSQGRNISI